MPLHMALHMSLPLEADPGPQLPMPFAAAGAYVQDVMRWERELGPT